MGKRLDEDDLDENGDPKQLEYKATGAEGLGAGVYNVTKQQSKIAEIEDLKKQRRGQPNAPAEDDDEAWAKAFEESLKKGFDDDLLGGTGGKKSKLKKEQAEVRRMKKEA